MAAGSKSARDGRKFDMKTMRIAGCAGIAAALLATVAPGAFAQDLAGKTVEYVIPFSESGGSALRAAGRCI